MNFLVLVTVYTGYRGFRLYEFYQALGFSKAAQLRELPPIKAEMTVSAESAAEVRWLFDNTSVVELTFQLEDLKKEWVHTTDNDHKVYLCGSGIDWIYRYMDKKVAELAHGYKPDNHARHWLRGLKLSQPEGVFGPVKVVWDDPRLKRAEAPEPEPIHDILYEIRNPRGNKLGGRTVVILGDGTVALRANESKDLETLGRFSHMERVSGVIGFTSVTLAYDSMQSFTHYLRNGGVLPGDYTLNITKLSKEEDYQWVEYLCNFTVGMEDPVPPTSKLFDDHEITYLEQGIELMIEMEGNNDQNYRQSLIDLQDKLNQLRK